MARKKPVPKNPVGKKAQEIWGGPGATYVPRQDSKQIILRTATNKSRTSNHYTCILENVLKLEFTWTENVLDKAKR